MILLEEAIDIQERHWRLHWMLNLAQFQASITFESILIPMIGEQHKPLVGRILISDEDRNWDSVRELWTLKEKVKKSADAEARVRRQRHSRRRHERARSAPTKDARC